MVRIRGRRDASTPPAVQSAGKGGTSTAHLFDKVAECLFESIVLVVGAGLAAVAVIAAVIAFAMGIAVAIVVIRISGAAAKQRRVEKYSGAAAEFARQPRRAEARRSLRGGGEPRRWRRRRRGVCGRGRVSSERERDHPRGQRPTGAAAAIAASRAAEEGERCRGVGAI
jgi:hypothetical protein